jgi:hypothetical protein
MELVTCTLHECPVETIPENVCLFKAQWLSYAPPDLKFKISALYPQCVFCVILRTDIGLFPQRALTDWSLQQRRSVFPMRYALKL